EGGRGGGDVGGDVRAPAGGEGVQGIGDVEHRLVGAVEGGAKDRHDADGVLVAVGDGRLGGEVGGRADRHQPGLDVPVPAELLPYDLDVGPHDQVGPVGRGPRGDPAPSPVPLERQAAEHAVLTGARRRAAGR